MVFRLLGKNTIFGADMGSSVHDNNNNKKDVLILGKGPVQGLGDTTLTAEVQYSINFTEKGKKFYLSLHYNESSGYLFVNKVKIYYFKPKYFELNIYPLCFGSNSNNLAVDNIKEAGLNEYAYDFLVGSESIGANDILINI